MGEELKADPAKYKRYNMGHRHLNTHLSSVPWVGGKSCIGGSQIGIWILRMLPKPANPAYIEPFGGSGAILINKPQVNNETYNDADGRLVNFWKQMQNPELEEMLEDTPYAETEFDRALSLLDSEDKLEAAWAFAAVLWMRSPVSSKLENSFMNISCYVHPLHKTTDRNATIIPLTRKMDFPKLRERLRNVQMANRDACDLLKLSAKYDYVDIYCDPPYVNTQDGGYGAAVDFDRLTDMLLAQKGRVAISGVEGDWEHLGWRCETFDKPALLSNRTAGKRRRLECLWMNYPAEFSVWDGQMALGDAV